MLKKQFLIVSSILLASFSIFPVIDVFAQNQSMNFVYYTNWGSAGEEDGQFSGQNDVDYFNGKVYVPDYENHRIQIFDPEGNFIAKFGEGGEGDGQFHKASALSMDSEGNIYVADQFNYRIQKFDNNG